MSRRTRRRTGPPPAPAAGFWGGSDVASLPPAPIRPTEEPTAVVDSLGAPPLVGHETAAIHYFAAVYAKAVGGASALAAAAGLLDTGPTRSGDESESD